MREIKFRAWDNTRKQWIWEDEFLVAPQYGGVIPWYNDGNTGYAQHDTVLMQYTGLKDKNGKEIYEWDVVVEGGDKHPSVVTFLQGSFQLVHNHYNLAGEVTGVYEQVLGFLIEPVEIIGNIYENPELLTNK